MRHFLLTPLLVGFVCSTLYAESHIAAIAPTLLGEPSTNRPSGVAGQQRRYTAPGGNMLEDFGAAWNGDFKNKRYNIGSQFRDASNLVRAKEEEARKEFINAQNEIISEWETTNGIGRKKGFSPGGKPWYSAEAKEEARLKALNDRSLFNELDKTFGGAISSRLKNTSDKDQVIKAINELRHSSSKEEYEKNLKAAFEGLNAAGISPRLVFGADGQAMGHPFANTSQWQPQVCAIADRESRNAG